MHAPTPRTVELQHPGCTHVHTSICPNPPARTLTLTEAELACLKTQQSEQSSEDMQIAACLKLHLFSMDAGGISAWVWIVASALMVSYGFVYMQ